MLKAHQNCSGSKEEGSGGWVLKNCRRAGGQGSRCAWSKAECHRTRRSNKPPVNLQLLVLYCSSPRHKRTTALSLGRNSVRHRGQCRSGDTARPVARSPPHKTCLARPSCLYDLDLRLLSLSVQKAQQREKKPPEACPCHSLELA